MCRQRHDLIFACQSRCSPRYCSGACTFYHYGEWYRSHLPEYLYDLIRWWYYMQYTCWAWCQWSCFWEGIENIKAWVEENLMKLNLSKTKELVIWERTTLPPPEPIVTIKRVSYLKLLGVTFQDSPTNQDKHFDDLMERAEKRMHILRVCKRNGYSVSDLDYLFNCHFVSFCLLY